jgi:hypothetical protein
MKTTVKITKYQNGDFSYYEATFLNGNLLAYSMFDLVSQLVGIYGFKSDLFSYLFSPEKLN